MPCGFITYVSFCPVLLLSNARCCTLPLLSIATVAKYFRCQFLLLSIVVLVQLRFYSLLLSPKQQQQQQQPPNPPPPKLSWSSDVVMCLCSSVSLQSYIVVAKYWCSVPLLPDFVIVQRRSCPESVTLSCCCPVSLLFTVGVAMCRRCLCRCCPESLSCAVVALCRCCSLSVLRCVVAACVVVALSRCPVLLLP